MRRSLLVGLSVLLMLGGLAACGGKGTSATGPVGGNTCLGGDGDFVTADGTTLAVDDQAFHLYAATIYPDVTANGKTYRDTAWTLPTFTTYIDQMLKDAKAAGINTIRATDFLNTVDNWQDSTIWANMDYLLCHARAQKMHVILDLSTFGKMLYHQGNFPYDPGEWGALLDFVGQRYHNERVIAYYAIDSNPLPPNGNDPLSPTTNQLLTFYRDTSLQLSAVDAGHHLISTGGLAFLNSDYGIPWQAIFGLSTVDIAAIQVYSDADRTISLPKVATWAAQNDKPFIIDEFGYQQKLGDAARADAYAALLSQAHTAGAAGVGFWNLGPEVAGQSYDVSTATPLTWAAVHKGAPSATTGSP